VAAPTAADIKPGNPVGPKTGQKPVTAYEYPARANSVRPRLRLKFGRTGSLQHDLHLQSLAPSCYCNKGPVALGIFMQRLLSVAAATGIVAAVLLGPAQAATEAVLYNFQSADTGNPTSRLLLQNGNLFGVAIGYDGCCGGIFRLKSSDGAWSYRSLVEFSDCCNGQEPFAGLTPGPNGWLYGTASLAGKYGGGTLFRTRKGKIEVLWNFGNGSDGAVPNGDLIIDSSGTIYGTTFYGGAGGWGTVFSLAPSGDGWKEQLLHSFNGADGGFPASGLLFGNGGRIYGTSDGSVFRLIQSGGVWTETTIYNPGDASNSTLVKDSHGNLFGTTLNGGSYDAGTVFEVSLSDGVWKGRDIYTFTGGSDGLWPVAGLHLNNDGSLYGTTKQGGTHGVGTVFKLSETGGVWSEKVVYSFAGGTHDGAQPFAAVIVDPSGRIYGTTPYGGAGGYGTVYEITP
jgi:uncharacterized repeat protein (TIGR03803 family)